jgi:hypothetical protein
MSWQIENAKKRVFNVFKRNKDKIYNEDIEALKTINTELELKRDKYVNDNLLYAKLLAILLTTELRYTKDIKASIKEIGSDLSKPLDFHLDFLRMNLNDIDLESHLNYLGLLDFDFWDVTQETKQKKNKIINSIEPKMIDKIKHNWTLENVKKSFYNTANQFLQETDNYI